MSWRVEVLYPRLTLQIERSSPTTFRAAWRTARAQTVPPGAQVQLVHTRRGWVVPLRWRA